MRAEERRRDGRRGEEEGKRRGEENTARLKENGRWEPQRRRGSSPS